MKETIMYARMMSLAILLLSGACAARAATLDCSGKDNWAAGSAYAQLKNAGITGPGKVDWDKVTVTLLATEQVGPDLYRQVHLVVFPQVAGGSVEVITRNDASSEECSVSPVEVYVVSKRL